jgi:hypothetical protein
MSPHWDQEEQRQVSEPAAYCKPYILDVAPAMLDQQAFVDIDVDSEITDDSLR